MGPLDQTGLGELRELVLALAEDLDGAIAHGYRCDYTGEDLRAGFRALVHGDGLEAALVAARHHYHHQVRLCEAPGLPELVEPDRCAEATLEGPQAPCDICSAQTPTSDLCRCPQERPPGSKQFCDRRACPVCWLPFANCCKRCSPAYRSMPQTASSSEPGGAR